MDQNTHASEHAIHGASSGGVPGRNPFVKPLHLVALRVLLWGVHVLSLLLDPLLWGFGVARGTICVNCSPYDEWVRVSREKMTSEVTRVLCDIAGWPRFEVVSACRRILLGERK